VGTLRHLTMLAGLSGSLGAGSHTHGMGLVLELPSAHIPSAATNLPVGWWRLVRRLGWGGEGDRALSGEQEPLSLPRRARAAAQGLANRSDRRPLPFAPQFRDARRGGV